MGQPSTVASGRVTSGKPSIGERQVRRKMRSRNAGASASPMPFLGATVGTVGSSSTPSSPKRSATLRPHASRNAWASLTSAPAACSTAAKRAAVLAPNCGCACLIQGPSAPQISRGRKTLKAASQSAKLFWVSPKSMRRTSTPS